jgi:transposase
MLDIFRVDDTDSRLGSVIMSAPDRIVQLTDALAVEIRRRQQLEAENAALRAHVATTGTTPDVALENQALRAVVADLTEKLEVMTARMVLMTQRTFGRSGERAHPDQQHLDEILCQILVADALTPDVVTDTTTSVVESTTETTPSEAAAASAPTTPSAPRTKRRGRLALPDTLPTEDRVMEVPESERMGSDGKPLPQIGVRIVEKLDYLPAWFRRLRLIYAIYGVPFSDEPRITAAPLPCVVPKGLPTDPAVAMVLVEKYDFHCPLNRQETKLERSGIDLSRATLMNWVRHGATALVPIQTAIGDAIKQHPVIGLDDTWIRVLDPGAGRTHQSRLWGYYADDEFYCEYQRTRQGLWPAEFLGAYRGTIMADAFSGHHRLFTAGQMTAAGCMAHTQRKFDEALAVGELLASQALDLFALLYRIERETAGRPIDQRLRRRQTEAIPILDRLEKLITGWEADQRHSSRLYMASHYTRKIFPTLRVYTTNGIIPIDNNDLERLWRQPSINRKNSLFVGSDRGGDWAATMFTICQSCRLVDIDPYKYLVDIFAELHTGRKDYANLRPKAWAAKNRTMVA